MANTFYLRPHDGTLAIGSFATSADAATFYHAHMDLSGCDIVEAVDSASWPASGNSLFYRYEFQEATAAP